MLHKKAVTNINFRMKGYCQWNLWVHIWTGMRGFRRRDDVEDEKQPGHCKVIKMWKRL